MQRGESLTVLIFPAATSRQKVEIEIPSVEQANLGRKTDVEIFMELTYKKLDRPFLVRLCLGNSTHRRLY